MKKIFEYLCGDRNIAKDTYGILKRKGFEENPSILIAALAQLGISSLSAIIALSATVLIYIAAWLIL